MCEHDLFESCEDCESYDAMNGNCIELDQEGDTCPKVSLNILNLYSGLGGNRTLWTDCKVTSVEYDGAIADVYAKKFPNDKVIVGDALEYVESHFAEYDFIWASPPCPSHGQYRHNVGVLGKGFNPIIPDMTSLYGLIVFLQTYYKGKWCVENVVPYYTPLIEPRFYMHRHLFWANFMAEHREFSAAEIRTKNKISDFDGYELVAESKIKNKRQALRNCVDAELGRHILQQAFRGDL